MGGISGQILRRSIYASGKGHPKCQLCRMESSPHSQNPPLQTLYCITPLPLKEYVTPSITIVAAEIMAPSFAGSM